MTLLHWASKWRIPPEALKELSQHWPTDPSNLKAGARSEAAVVASERMSASLRGGRLWRNNVGAFEDKNGNYVRYGLCNESAQMNHRIKSADLIGIEPVLITAEMVGSTIGRFEAVECKAPGWTGVSTPHEHKQKTFLNLVNSLGGRGRFAS